jgi:hypothetical protein
MGFKNSGQLFWQCRFPDALGRCLHSTAQSFSSVSFTPARRSSPTYSVHKLVVNRGWGLRPHAGVLPLHPVQISERIAIGHCMRSISMKRDKDKSENLSTLLLKSVTNIKGKGL